MWLQLICRGTKYNRFCSSRPTKKKYFTVIPHLNNNYIFFITKYLLPIQKKNPASLAYQDFSIVYKITFISWLSGISKYHSICIK